MKPPQFFRRYDYDKALLPNKYLASIEEGLSDIEEAKARIGYSIGYPGWNLLYYILLAHLYPDRFNAIVETGTNWGGTTIMLAQALKDSGHLGRVYTVEIDKNNYDIAQDNFKKAGVTEHIYSVNSDSRDFLKTLKLMCSSVRIALLDASHLFNDVISEFDLIYPLLGDQSIVIFDNTYLIAEPHEDQRVNGALKEILQKYGGNLVNFEFVSWYTPGIAIWQKKPLSS